MLGMHSVLGRGIWIFRKHPTRGVLLILPSLSIKSIEASSPNLAANAGMDPGVLSAYLRYQDGMVVHNSVARGIGKGFLRRIGIPQGCPFSMLFMALLLRPWHMQQAKKGKNAFSLADEVKKKIQSFVCL